MLPNMRPCYILSNFIDAPRDSGAASAEYREHLRVLYSLETALIQVKRLEVDELQHVELIALRQAAAQCKRMIDNFWSKVKKYQPHLGVDSAYSNFRMKTAWVKIKWALCGRGDLVRLKADLIGNTESIQVLLAVIQMYGVMLHGEDILLTFKGSRSHCSEKSDLLVNVRFWDGSRTRTSLPCSGFPPLLTA
jgi:hypothetical protein